MTALSPQARAWVEQADRAAVAAYRAEQEDYLEHAPSYLRDVFDPDEDGLDPEESWPTPYGPDIPAGAPVLLADVDGALSPFKDPHETGLADPDDPTKWPIWEPHHIALPDTPVMNVPLAPAMGAALAGLGVQIVFLTTWNEHANTDIAPRLGWEPMPVLDERAGHTFSSERAGWAKLHVVKRWLRTYGPRPLVWMDDDYRLDDLVPTDPYWAALPHRMTVRTHRDTGITPAQVAQIRTFLDGLPSQ